MVSIDDDNVKIINVLAGDEYFCKNWRSFCNALKFENDILHDLDRMDARSASTRDIIIDILGYWKSISLQNYDAKTLSEKLREMGCSRSAETIESRRYSEDTQAESRLVWFNVRPLTRFYAGREKEMEIINVQWIECLKKKMLLFVAITGLGGIGKSELAANYAKHFHESTQGHCVWINAESKQTLLQSIQNLAKSELKISLTDQSGQEKELNLVEQINTKLADKKCLYIFDNLDSYEQPTIQLLKELASKQRPSALRPFVLMTSRYQPAKEYFGNNCKSLQLDILDDEAGIKFFCDSFELKENLIRGAPINEVIQRLCQRLNYFPLAMHQAAAYINRHLQHDLKIDVSEVEEEILEYLEKIETQTVQLLNHKIPDDSRTTFLTWGITFAKISKMADGGIDPKKLMNIISFMSPDNISVEFVMRIFEKIKSNSSSNLNRDALQILQDHSMVKVQRKKILSVHRLVQDVTRIKLQEESAWIATLDPLLQIVQEMVIAKEIQSEQLIHVQRIWKHATENAELVEKHAEFPSSIIKTLDESGKYREMLDFSCQAQNTLESTLGEKHRSTLKTKFLRGDALCCLGEYLKALEVLTEVYEKQKELFGEEDNDCLYTGNQIGLVHYRLEKYDDALEWFSNALEKREKIFGEEHHGTIYLKNNMALVLYGQEKYKEAMELFQQALEVAERVMGKEHLQTLMTKHNIAAATFSQGEYSDALKMFLEVLEAKKTFLDVSHPETLNTKEWIARTYSRLGRTEEAIELLREVLEKMEEIFGPEHRHTLYAKQNLATLSCREGERVKRGNNFGEEHPHKAKSNKKHAPERNRK